MRFWQCYNDCVTTLRNSGNSIDLDEQAPGLLMSSSIIPTFPTSYVWSHLLVGGYLWSSAIVGSIPEASINVVKFDNLEQLDRLYLYIVWLLQIKGGWQIDKAWWTQKCTLQIFWQAYLAKRSNFGFGFVTQKHREKCSSKTWICNAFGKCFYCWYSIEATGNLEPFGLPFADLKLG